MSRKLLRILALVLFLGCGLVWFALGANRGWTKTSVASKTLDQVTGIEGITYQKRFVPGVDFLGAAGLASIALIGASLILKTNSNRSVAPNQNKPN